MISVIIPFYNAEKYLADCLESIIGQTYSDLEIICVNDGSTDNSLTVAEKYQKNDKRIRILSQKNSGVSAARNRGIDHASGDFITFVDSDDSISQDMYDILYSFMTDNTVDIVHCGYRRHNQDGTIQDVNGTEKLIIQDSLEAVRCLIDGELFVGSLCNKLYRKELFKAVRLDTELKINEDVLANVQLFLKAKRTIYYDIPAYQYFDRPHSATSDTEKVISAQNCVAAAEKILELVKGTAVENSALIRLLYARITEYRVRIFADNSAPGSTIRELQGRIEEGLSVCSGVSIKQKINYGLMKRAPELYRQLYQRYDHIRKPNWDVN
ncbi:MAG: glycosyltransferase [Lachnospiraceae bacterium]|nr:glycosyltransferase [Lachnospiraceae bacterium]